MREHPRKAWPGRTGIRIVRLLAGVAVFLAAFRSLSIAQNVAREERDLTRELAFGVSRDYYPYSYLRDDGSLAGFTIDLTNAVARLMEMKVRWVLLPNSGLPEPLLSGRVDAVPFISETPSRDTRFDFSVPVVELDVGVVVRADDPRIHRLIDLQNMHIAVGHKGSHGERILNAFLKQSVPVYTENWEECLRDIQESKCDGAIMTQMTALALIDRLKIKGLRVMESKLPGFPVRYAFAVRKGDSALLARYNEGLVTLHNRGEFDEIYQRWFGRYESPKITRAQILQYIALALAFGLLGASIAFFRQRALLRRIAAQAAELAEQRALLSALFENHPLATVVMDIVAGEPPRFVSVNREACRLFGKDPATLVGRELDRLGLSADFRRLFDQLLERWQASGGPYSFEVRLPVNRLVVESTIIGIGTASAGKRRACVLIADVTKRRMMDQEMTRARRVQALGELVGGIAHEFNNLLTPILAIANMLKVENSGNESLAENLSVIEHASLRAADLTRRLLTFGRKSADQREAVRLSDAVANCFALIQPTIDRRIELRSEVPADLPCIAANTTDVNQILFNLIVNSRDALVDKLAQATAGDWTPRLTVRAAELTADPLDGSPERKAEDPGGWIQISVEDNGPGIAPENVDRLFDPFFTTKEVGKGTGLGLSTVWHLVTEAGGQVRVAANSGLGARFEITLPKDTQSRNAPAQVIAGTPPAAQRPGNSCLVVEDNPLVARSTARLLERLGSRTVVAQDGEAGWHTFSAGPEVFALLLVDVNLPKMNGIDFVRRVRGTPFRGKIIMMSGNLTDAEIATLRALRVDQILAKPFTVAELSAALG